jgi:hypothetical protein
MRILLFIGLLLCLLLPVAACGGPDSIPKEPTWVDDVEPILRAHCFHCHGPGQPDAQGEIVRADPDAFRWDIYDKSVQAAPFGLEEEFDGQDWVGNLLEMDGYFTAGEKERMPPAPARRLSQRDINVLKRWKKRAFGKEPPPRGVRMPNHKPTASWLDKPTRIVVTDGDYETVLGKLVCAGGKEQLLRQSGAHVLMPGIQPPCTATLHDGQDMVTVMLE